MRKRYFLITFAIITIIAGVWVLACKHPTGEGTIPGVSTKENDGNGGNSESEIVAYLSQEEQNADYEHVDILFTGGTTPQIPALTVTSREVLIAASGQSAGNVKIKRSSDLGMTWEDLHFTPENGYSYPFFINCHNGDILLGVTTAATSANSKTIFYRSKNDGETWTKEGSSIDLNTVTNSATDSSVNYGQGIALRHGGNLGSQKLMFPYSYNAPDGSKAGCYVAIMFSENGSANFNSICENFKISGKEGPTTKRNIGSFGSYISKVIELANGDILLNMRCTTDGNMFWMVSQDCGKNWDILTVNTSPENTVNNNKKEGVRAKNADLVRYEFNGKDIKLGGDKYALMITSYERKPGYDVMLTVNDFNHGKPDGGTANKYKYTKNIPSASTGLYPAITVLPDGTIATLTEDSGDLYFKRFNLYWLTSGAESINYSTDTSVKF
ncbi:exo-alpha-sialidase [Brachyspira aalborgi]|uniref:sialidase family protein n=1 Tax=Brachyspira aalborgi TaxID=29522 RepID=UPI0011CC68BF|nr:sialidase family protein [Brachyspira aalborgi]TXJ13968.1 exo-alpha-sialidase [Brachyspira aalborgi]TXJ17669.1 exo-alpha-sialidase [Brachyspira aalborgi]